MSLSRDMMPAWELQAALEQAESTITRLRAEVERLRAALKETASDFEMSLQIDKQKDAENERLRAALKPFVCDCSSNCAWERDEICPDWNARAALEEKR